MQLHDMPSGFMLQEHPLGTAESWAKEVLVHCREFLLAELPSLNSQKMPRLKRHGAMMCHGTSGINESTSTILPCALRHLSDEQLFEPTQGPIDPIGTTGSTTGSVGICSTTRDGLNTTCKICKLHKHAAT